MSFVRSRAIATSSLRHLSTSTSASAPASAPTPTHHLITLNRSPIALPEAIRGTLAVLGLRRRQQNALHKFSPEVTGRILRVKELVTVINVTEEEGLLLATKSRSEGSGVEPSGRVYGGGKGRMDVTGV
ncbi:ribosomal protein L30 [Cryptococcus sp. DSM 104549]